MIVGSRVRTRLLTHFHLFPLLKNSKSGGDELGKVGRRFGKVGRRLRVIHAQRRCFPFQRQFQEILTG